MSKIDALSLNDPEVEAMRRLDAYSTLSALLKAGKGDTEEGHALFRQLTPEQQTRFNTEHAHIGIMGLRGG